MYQWELEQKKTDDLEVLKNDRIYLAKTMENKVPHLMLMRWVRSVLLAYVIKQHFKVACV